MPEAGRASTVAFDTQPCSLSWEAELACNRAIGISGRRTYFDVDLDPQLPPIRCDRWLLGDTIQQLLRAATIDIDESWGFVTVMTGQTRVARSHRSAAHPVPARPAALARDAFLFLEVHDTQATLEPLALEAIRNEVRVADPRVDALVEATILTKKLGGSLHIDSTPGCGSQSLLLLPRR